MLKSKVVQLERLDLSENEINEEGINIILRAKTDFDGLMLFKGLSVNKMKAKNDLISNTRAVRLEAIEMERSFAETLDLTVAIKGFTKLGYLNNPMRILNFAYNRISS